MAFYVFSHLTVHVIFLHLSPQPSELFLGHPARQETPVRFANRIYYSRPLSSIC